MIFFVLDKKKRRHRSNIPVQFVDTLNGCWVYCRDIFFNNPYRSNSKLWTKLTLPLLWCFFYSHHNNHIKKKQTIKQHLLSLSSWIIISGTISLTIFLSCLLIFFILAVVHFIACFCVLFLFVFEFELCLCYVSQWFNNNINNNPNNYIL